MSDFIDYSQFLYATGFFVMAAIGGLFVVVRYFENKRKIADERRMDAIKALIASENKKTVDILMGDIKAGKAAAILTNGNVGNIRRQIIGVTKRQNADYIARLEKEGYPRKVINEIRKGLAEQVEQMEKEVEKDELNQAHKYDYANT